MIGSLPSFLDLDQGPAWRRWLVWSPQRDFAKGGGHMAETSVRAAAHRPEWFESWFDSFHYHKLYAYRDDTEAAAFLNDLLAQLRPRPGARVLDLGCGAGRHSKHLASKGFHVTGMDLAAGSIKEAKKFERPRLRFLQHDMRVPFGRNAFDCLFSFFTSFGYFEKPGENAAVIRNMAESLRPGGQLVLDYLNIRYAEARLMAEEFKEIDGTTYRLTRWTDARHFYKRIVVDDGASGPLEFVERVARFTLEDFERMCAPHVLRIEKVLGDYRLRPYDSQASPRMILVARKNETGSGVDYLRDRFLRTRLSVSGETPRYDASMNCGTRCTMDGYFATNAS
jgi:SAM-dependent methyltransferase